MGCDVHAYVEKRVGGKWIPAQGFLQVNDEDVPNVPYPDRVLWRRNYDLFAYLAGVRNRHHHAVEHSAWNVIQKQSREKVASGKVSQEEADRIMTSLNAAIDKDWSKCWHDCPFKPLSEPKGLPEDASPEVRAVFERWGNDAHSATWFTVKELLVADWSVSMPTQVSATVEDLDEIRKELAKSLDQMDRSWLRRMVEGEGLHNAFNAIRRRHPSVGDDAKLSPEVSKEMSAIPKESFNIPMAVLGSELYDKLRYLLSYDSRLESSDIRIVLWFDN